MKKIFNILYYIFFICVVSIALLLLVTSIPISGNLKAKIVKSGSMEPAIKVGALVFIVPTSSYKVGDIITFGLDTKIQIPTTHRIVSIAGEGQDRTFTTKGDANDAPDSRAIRYDELKGKVVFSIPYLGYILDFAKKPLGFMLLVGIPAGLIIFDELTKIFNEVSAMKRKKLSNAKD